MPHPLVAISTANQSLCFTEIVVKVTFSNNLLLPHLWIQPNCCNAALVFKSITVFSYLFSPCTHDSHSHFCWSAPLSLQMHPNSITFSIQYRRFDSPCFYAFSMLKYPSALCFFSICNTIPSIPGHALNCAVTDRCFDHVTQLTRCQPIRSHASQWCTHFLHSSAHATIFLNPQYFIHRLPAFPFFIQIDPPLVSHRSYAAYQPAFLCPYILPSLWQSLCYSVVYFFDSHSKCFLSGFYCYSLDCFF